jgi:hypothetical protein
MDTKEIVEKALKGEAYEELVKDLDPDQLIQVKKDIAAGFDKQAVEAKDKVSAIRQETQRLEDKKKALESTPIDVQKQFREEQVTKAKDIFFNTFSLTEEEKTAFEAEFAKVDSGKVDPDFIIKDMKKAYLNLNPDKFIEANKKVQEFEKNAADFNANGAGAPGGGTGGDDDKYTQAARDLHKAWQKQGMNLTLADAQRQIDKGENWNQNKLS